MLFDWRYIPSSDLGGDSFGFHRIDATRYSMLLSIPTILAAGALSALELIETGNTALGTDAVIAAVLAFGSAYLAINLLLRWLRRATFTPFVIYRVGLGIADLTDDPVVLQSTLTTLLKTQRDQAQITREVADRITGKAA